VPCRYRLSGPGLAVAEDWLRACGAVPVKDAAVGDIGLVEMGEGARAQLHLVLLGRGGAVHAHAGLRRVVFSPLPLAGVLLGRWRVSPSPLRLSSKLPSLAPLPGGERERVSKG
jgi:murein DD-endopeptidase / murein LD-carboxypeptidase